MSSLFPYLLEVSIILLLLYAFYFLALRHKASPSFNRSYLLLSLLFALIVPTLSIPLFLGGDGESSFIFQPASKAWNLLPELVIGGGSKPETAIPGASEIPWLQYASYLYLAGSLISILFTTGRLWKLSRLIRQYPFHYTNSKRYKIAPTAGKLPTFSFLHFIFWDDTAPLSGEEAKLVLRHEQAHVQQYHSIDNIALELLQALLWFNPTIYAYRHSLRQVHEHLADRYALGEAEPESYFSLLVKQTLRQANIPLASQFFQHNTLNRIKMLQTKSNRTILRAAIGACIFGIIFFVAACQDESLLEQEKDPTEKSSQSSTALGFHSTLDVEELENGSTQAKKLEDHGDFILFIFNGYQYTISDLKNPETKETVMKELEEASPKHFGEVIQLLEDATGGMVKPGKKFQERMKKEVEEYKNDSPKLSVKGNRIFEVVEEAPSPVGGMEAFYAYLSNNLKYPEQAQEKGVEGRVFVQFVVETDGSVTGIKVVKGIGAGCDEAATEVIQTTKWEPGKQRGQEVAVRMVMPVMFKL